MANKIKLAGTTSNTFQIGSNGVTLDSNNATAPYTLKLPPNAGDIDQILQTDGNGTLSWVDVSGSGSMYSDTIVATAGQTLFVLTFKPSGNPMFTINGVTIPSTAVTTANKSATYIPANNDGYIINAGDIVVISYLYGVSANVQTLDELADVSIVLPANNQPLVYNSATANWVNGNISSIANGTSNVVVAASGNVTVGSAGNAGILTVTGTGANVTGNLSVTINAYAGNLQVGANASAGNLAVTENASAGNLAVTGNTSSGNLAVTGNANVGNLGTTGIIATGVSNLGPVGNVIITGGSNGQVLRTDGNGVLSWGTNDTQQITNGNSNVVVAANSNVTVSVAGNANIVTVTGTGANITGTANITGETALGNNLSVAGLANITGNLNVTGNVVVSGTSNLGAVANVRIANGSNGQYLRTDGNGNLAWSTINSDRISNGNSNVVVAANSNVTVSVAGNSNIVTVTGTGANVAGNLNVTEAIIAPNFVGSGHINGSSNVVVEPSGNVTISASGLYAALKVSDTAVDVQGNVNATGNIIGGNFIGQGHINGNSNVVVTANGNVTVSAAGNAGILTVTGTGANVAGTLGVTGNITSANANTGNLSVTGVSNLGAVANVRIANGTSGQYLRTDGNSNLTWSTIDTDRISNGSSNVLIATANGNVTVSSNGVANIIQVSGDSNVSVIKINSADGEIGDGFIALTNTVGLLEGQTITAAGILSPSTTITAINEILNIVTLSSSLIGNAPAGTQFTIIGSSSTVQIANNLVVGGVANLGAVANVRIANGTSGQYLRTDGNSNLTWSTINTDSISNGNSNVVVAANANVTVSSNGVANVVSVSGTGVNVSGTLGVTGNITSANANTGNMVVTGNITSGNSNTGNMAVTGGLTVSGVTNLGAVANVRIANGTSGQYLQTDGAGNLSWSTITNDSISNGNSNVVVAANANVTISSNGVANVVTVTGTGANVSGTLGVTGNVTTGNLTTGNITANTANLGTLAKAATVETGLIRNGNSNIGITSNGNISMGVIGVANIVQISNALMTIGANVTTTGNISAVDLALSGNANITGNAAVTGNITSGNANLGALAIAAAVQTGTVQNGNTNIALAANGNVTMSVSGTANVVQISNTLINTSVGITSAGNLSAVNLTLSGAAAAAGNITTNANINANTLSSANSDLYLKAAGANKTIFLQPTGTGIIDAGNAVVGNVAAPVNAGDVTNKEYVDALAQGLRPKAPVKAATVADIGGTYNNGTLGVGATLTFGSPIIDIDGYSLNNGNRILVKNQADPAHNGIYVVTSDTVFTRSTDFDVVGEMPSGASVFVENGTVNNDTTYVLVSNVATVGTSQIDFVLLARAGEYTAGPGLTLTGSQFSVATTGVNAASYGNGDRIATFTVDATGRLTQANSVVSAANAANLTGTNLANTVVNSSLQTLGNLTGLTVTGNASFTGANVSLGNVANLKIIGGANGQVLSTDGTGNLRWANGGSATALTNGNSNVIVAANANITMSSNGVANVVRVSALANGSFTKTGFVAAGESYVFFGTNNLDKLRAGQIIECAGVLPANTTITGFLESDSVTISNNAIGTGPLGTVFTITGQISTVNISDELAANSITSAYKIANGNTSITIFDASPDNPGVGGGIKINANGRPNAISIDESTVTIDTVLTIINGQVVLGSNGPQDISIPYGANNQLLASDGLGHLKWVDGGNAVSSMSNGNSNISIALNSSITMSSRGVANVLTIGDFGVVTKGAFTSNGTFTSNGNATFAGDIIPSANATYSIGNATRQWKDLWITNSTIYVGGVPLGTANGALTVSNVPVVTQGSSFSGSLANGNSNIVVASSSNVTVSSNGVANVIQVNANANANITQTTNPNVTVASGNTLVFSNVDGFGVGKTITSTSNVLAANTTITAINGFSVTLSANITNTVSGNTPFSVITNTSQVQFADSIAVTGVSNLGTVGNVRITGGNSGQLLRTNGNGGLSWADASATSIINGNSNIIVAANGNISMGVSGINNIVRLTYNPNATPIKLLTTAANVGDTILVLNDVDFLSTTKVITSPTSGILLANTKIDAVFTNNNSIRLSDPLIGNASVGTQFSITTAVSGISLIANSITISGLTSFSNVSNVRIGGGSNGQVLTTNGNGVLTWANGGAGGGSNAITNGNSNVSVAANGNVTVSVAGNSNVVTVTGTGANIAGTLQVSGVSNLGAVGNVRITGGSNGQVLSTDGNGVLSWAAGGSSLTNGNSNIVISPNANVNISSNGVANIVQVTANNQQIFSLPSAVLANIGDTTITLQPGSRGNIVRFTAGSELFTSGVGILQGNTTITAVSGLDITIDKPLIDAAPVGTPFIVIKNTSLVKIGATDGDSVIVEGLGIKNEQVMGYWLTANGAPSYDPLSVYSTKWTKPDNINSDPSGTITRAIIKTYSNSPYSNANSTAVGINVSGYDVITSEIVLSPWDDPIYENPASKLNLGADLTTFPGAGNIQISGGTNGKFLVSDANGYLKWSDTVNIASSNFAANIIKITADVPSYNIVTTGSAPSGTDVLKFGSSEGLVIGRFLTSSSPVLQANTAISDILFDSGSYFVTISKNLTNSVSFGTNFSSISSNSIVEIANNLVVGGVANLGPVGNVRITGGSNGQVLTTNGNGVLTWTSGGGGSGGSTIANGNSNISIPTSGGNITFSANGQQNIMVINTSAGTYAEINLNAGVKLNGNSPDLAGRTPSIVLSNGANMFVTANSNLIIGQIANINLDGNLNVTSGPQKLRIAGGNVGDYLRTDGASNLYWGPTPTQSLIQNGNSNVNISGSGANITFSVEGRSNALVIGKNSMEIFGGGGNYVDVNANINMIGSKTISGKVNQFKVYASSSLETIPNGSVLLSFGTTTVDTGGELRYGGLDRIYNSITTGGNTSNGSIQFVTPNVLAIQTANTSNTDASMTFTTSSIRQSLYGNQGNTSNGALTTQISNIRWNEFANSANANTSRANYNPFNTNGKTSTNSSTLLMSAGNYVLANFSNEVVLKTEKFWSNGISSLGDPANIVINWGNTTATNPVGYVLKKETSNGVLSWVDFPSSGSNISGNAPFQSQTLSISRSNVISNTNSGTQLLLTTTYGSNNPVVELMNVQAYTDYVGPSGGGAQSVNGLISIGLDPEKVPNASNGVPVVISSVDIVSPDIRLSRIANVTDGAYVRISGNKQLYVSPGQDSLANGTSNIRIQSAGEGNILFGVGNVANVVAISNSNITLGQGPQSLIINQSGGVGQVLTKINTSNMVGFADIPAPTSMVNVSANTTARIDLFANGLIKLESGNTAASQKLQLLLGSPNSAATANFVTVKGGLILDSGSNVSNLGVLAGISFTDVAAYNYGQLIGVNQSGTLGIVAGNVTSQSTTTSVFPFTGINDGSNTNLGVTQFFNISTSGNIYNIGSDILEFTTVDGGGTKVKVNGVYNISISVAWQWGSTQTFANSSTRRNIVLGVTTTPVGVANTTILGTTSYEFPYSGGTFKEGQLQLNSTVYLQANTVIGAYIENKSGAGGLSYGGSSSVRWIRIAKVG